MLRPSAIFAIYKVFKEYPIYELVQTQGTTHFKLKTDAPSYVATVALGVPGATVVE